MSSNNWSEIDYEKVPSKANINYECAFMRKDEERRRAYLESLAKGEVKINASVSQPHEIVHKYVKGQYWFRDLKYNETLEQLWNALPKSEIGNTLVVRDGSGSMARSVSGSITALEVATALAIYCSESCRGGFKDTFITFSSHPELITLNPDDALNRKLVSVYDEDDMSNTDIYSTMKLVLDTALHYNLKQEDMPSTILIISDMQFDGNRFRFGETLFESIQRQFEDCGYELPRICFWNLNPYDAKTIPLQRNNYGVILCSGFSTNNLKMFMSGEIDPFKVLLEAINSERYDAIEEALR